VVAEGIETEAERAFLDGAQCSMGQGYLFARPMPADSFEAFLAAQAASSPARPAPAAFDVAPTAGPVFSPADLDDAGPAGR